MSWVSAPRHHVGREAKKLTKKSLFILRGKVYKTTSILNKKSNHKNQSIYSKGTMRDNKQREQEKNKK